MGGDQKRALLAVVLSGAILFGWQYFFATPNVYQSGTSGEQEKVSSSAPSAKDSGSIVAATGKEEEVPVEATFIAFENERNKYVINNQLRVVEGSFKPVGTEIEDFFTPDSSGIQFLVGDVYRSINFNLKEDGQNRALFSNSDLGITGQVELDEKGFLVFKLSADKPFGYRFQFSESIDDDDKGGLFSMQVGKQFGYFTDEYNTLGVASRDNGEGIMRWFSVDNEYHLIAYVLEDRVPMLYRTNEKGGFVISSPDTKSTLEFRQIFARKEYDQLGALGYNLDKSIDFGIWGIIAVPILRGLQFFYSLIPNYGISIILLTIIIRMLTFPLQYKSFKSMKKMQEIQPQLNKLKEKYKNDPQKMQQETMTLFKQAGANPLGGCLPMLLQMPIFFAFYKVLYSSVELVNAPFFGWINDLSQKDPFYVLPVLMGLSMVLNQKLMPTTISDPVQKKVMLFMPLIFAVFMKDFPAGLTLYILVSTIMGMGQQLFVFKRA